MHCFVWPLAVPVGLQCCFDVFSVLAGDFGDPVHWIGILGIDSGVATEAGFRLLATRDSITLCGCRLDPCHLQTKHQQTRQQAISNNSFHDFYVNL